VTERGAGRRRWLPWLLVPVAAGAALAGCTSSGSSSTTNSNASGSASSTVSCPVTSVADKVLPSVVTIAAAGPGGSGTGSGEVIRSDGYILTNNHVIAIAANGGKVEVMFSDGTSVPATIVGRDVLTDLAVLKVAQSDNLKVIGLGSSSSVQVGQPVVAIGAPLGLSGTVTSGIISAMDRTVEVPAEDDRSALLVSALQTDAAINPGNSGGALVNCSGDLIGVPTAGATVPTADGGSSAGSVGLGFAIPVNLAKTISDEIISTGRVSHSYFGVQTVPIPADAAAQAGLKGGLFVAGVVAGGPAAKAGLQQGDVITEINGQTATTNVQLQELTLTKQPGDTVTIGYARDGATGKKTTVTLSSQP
jgi:putative serine protease PepD